MSLSHRIAKQINATGTPGFHEHTFEHPFMLMAFQFIAQALCIPIWLIITPAIARENNQAQENAAERQQAYDVPILNNDEPNIQENDNADDDDDVPLLNNEVQPNNPAWHNRPVDQRKFNKFLFLVPAFFDLSRTALLYVALRLSYNSSYMMIRSAAVLFTVLLRVAFLSKHMAKYMWVSIFMVIVGLGLIGMTDYVYDTPRGYDHYGLAAGDLLIVMSQIMIAMQIVYEEKFMDKHSIDPLRVVGLEGLFGAIVSITLLIPFSFVSSGPFSKLPNSRIEDIKDAFLQMRSSWILALCVVGSVVSKVIYYYAGTRLVRNRHDSATRITIDVHHDLIIWAISLRLGWQKFFYPQIIGFILVPIGMMIYNDVLPLCAVCRPPEVPRPAGPLPNAEAINLEHNAVADGQGNHAEQVDD